ncbi:MAG: hypothetical protein M1812_007930 [Candelaria pacifica]|nr:MAG: hypothetical protein M1812_007930 [Candelaria pacifica]
MAANAFDVSAMGPGVSLYNGILQATPITQSVDAFICVVASIIVGFVWAPVNYINSVKITPYVTTLSANTETEKAISDTDPKTYTKASSNIVNTTVPALAEYSVILVFTTLGASILVSCTSLVTLYLGVELQSFAVYVLASLYRSSETSSAAALKYFFIGGLSSAFILMGGAVVYWQTGTTDLWHVISLLNQLPSNSDNVSGVVLSGETLVHVHAGTLLGLEAILLGILMKTASAPFHFWAPDVYDGVPTVVTTWLTLMPKISLLTFILHLSGSLYNTGVLDTTGTWYTPATWSTLIATCSMISLIIGTIVGLAQVRVKRLLAYSTISHVGFLVLALAVNTEIGVDAFAFYLTQYTITTLDAFLILLAFGYYLRAHNNDQRAHWTDFEINKDLAGQFHVNPVMGLAFSACLFSIAGVPPLVGFFGKQAVLYAAMQAGYGFLAFVGIVTSVVSASYYLGLVRAIHFETPTYTSNVLFQAVTPVHSYTIALLTLTVALFIFSPTLVLDSTGLLALVFHTA